MTPGPRTRLGPAIDFSEGAIQRYRECGWEPEGGKLVRRLAEGRYEERVSFRKGQITYEFVIAPDTIDAVCFWVYWDEVSYDEYSAVAIMGQDHPIFEHTVSDPSIVTSDGQAPLMIIPGRISPQDFDTMMATLDRDDTPAQMFTPENMYPGLE